MAQPLMKVYEVPVYHLGPATLWLHSKDAQYFSRFGWLTGHIQIYGTLPLIKEFEKLLDDLWTVRVTTTFRFKHRKLVLEELESWGIEYKRKFNPFALDVQTEIDQIHLERFIKAIETMTKKPKKDKNLKLALKSGVPDDISSLLE